MLTLVLSHPRWNYNGGYLTKYIRKVLLPLFVFMILTIGDKTVSDYLKNLEKIRTNPLLMIDYALDTLSKQLEGKGDFDIPDNTHPFAWAIENSIMVGALAMAEGESLMRRLYP